MIEPDFRLKYQYRANFLRVEEKARYNIASMTPCKRSKFWDPANGPPDQWIHHTSLAMVFWNALAVVLHDVGSKGSSVMKPRSLYLRGARPCKVSMCWSSSWSLRFTSASLTRCVLKGHGGKWVGVDPSFEWGKGEHLLAHLDSLVLWKERAPPTRYLAGAEVIIASTYCS